MKTLQSAPDSQPEIHPRRLILIDIENFNGQPIHSVAQAKWCKKMLTLWLDIQEGEIVIISSDKSGILSVNAGWKGPRLLMGMGPNGADHRLIEEIERMNFGQFDEIALVSGDGIFANPVAFAAEFGVPTKVYSHGVQLSHQLRFAASEVYLAEDGYAPINTTLEIAPTMNNNVIQLHPRTEETA